MLGIFKKDFTSDAKRNLSRNGKLKYRNIVLYNATKFSSAELSNQCKTYLSKVPENMRQFVEDESLKFQDSLAEGGSYQFWKEAKTKDLYDHFMVRCKRYRAIDKNFYRVSDKKISLALFQATTLYLSYLAAYYPDIRDHIQSAAY